MKVSTPNNNFSRKEMTEHRNNFKKKFAEAMELDNGPGDGAPLKGQVFLHSSLTIDSANDSAPTSKLETSVSTIAKEKGGNGNEELWIVESESRTNLNNCCTTSSVKNQLIYRVLGTDNGQKFLSVEQSQHDSERSSQVPDRFGIIAFS